VCFVASWKQDQWQSIARLLSRNGRFRPHLEINEIGTDQFSVQFAKKILIGRFRTHLEINEIRTDQFSVQFAKENFDRTLSTASWNEWNSNRSIFSIICERKFWSYSQAYIGLQSLLELRCFFYHSLAWGTYLVFESISTDFSGIYSKRNPCLLFICH
jgi:hypothetical protein